RGHESLGGVKRRGAALLEVAEGEHAGAQLGKPAGLGQRQAAHLLGGFLLAAGLDFSPVMLGTPLAVRPMLHLVGPPGLHSVSPTCWRGSAREKVVFGDNLPLARYPL